MPTRTTPAGNVPIRCLPGPRQPKFGSLASTMFRAIRGPTACLCALASFLGNTCQPSLAAGLPWLAGHFVSSTVWKPYIARVSPMMFLMQEVKTQWGWVFSLGRLSSTVSGSKMSLAT